MANILIVDDHPMSRRGIVAMLARETDLVVTAQADCAAEAKALVEAGTFDLALIDINLPDQNGLELIKNLKAMKPELRLIAISMHDESLYAERVLRAGAEGYFSKQSGGSELTTALRKVLEGGLYISDETTGKLLKVATHQRLKGSQDPLAILTDREFEVFQHIAEGRNTRTIAVRLGVSPRTVEAHRTNIKDKLGLVDMTELIHYAVKWSERTL